jgi:transcriptional regulator with XRE-family HTH domain
MSPEGFKTWRTIMGFSQAKAGEMLGLSKSTIEIYERGTRKDNGQPIEIPETVGLACAALYHRLAPWSDNDPRATGAD